MEFFDHRRVRYGLRVSLPVAVIGLLLVACSPDSEAPEDRSADEPPASEQANGQRPSGTKTERVLAAIDKLAEEGEVDKAAAQLVKLRMKGTRFSKDEAAAYRDSLSFVYDQALEYQDSAKGKAALKILQSNGAF